MESCRYVYKESSRMFYRNGSRDSHGNSYGDSHKESPRDSYKNSCWNRDSMDSSTDPIETATSNPWSVAGVTDTNLLDPKRAIWRPSKDA